MSLGLREERRRRNRRFRWTLAKWALALCLIGVAGVSAYESGSRLAEREVDRLEQEIASLDETVADLRRQNAEWQRNAETQRAEAAAWRERYDRDVPAGEIKELFDQVRAKLDAGVDPARLAFVIGAASNKRDCDEEPQSKRFILRTPLYEGTQHTVSFGDGEITVTGEGVSARDSAGNPEAWFDPAEPVTVRLVHIGGETQEVSGILPLNPSLVVGDTEYRFTIVTGGRGFVEVAMVRCSYP